MAKLDRKIETEESKLAKAPAVVDAIVDEITTGHTQLVESAMAEYDLSVKSAIGSVQHAAACGGILLKLKEQLPAGRSFVTMIEEDFKDPATGAPRFSWRTGYNYIEVYEALQRAAIKLETCKSVREALKLLAAGKEKEATDPERKDDKKETFMLAAMKIESWFTSENKESPTNDWTKKRLETVKRCLSGVGGIIKAVEDEIARREAGGKKGDAPVAEIF